MDGTDVDKQTPAKLGRMWNVSDFAKRFRLDRFEENRLIKVLGATATEHELLRNAGRRPL